MPNLGTELNLPGGGEAFVCNAGRGAQSLVAERLQPQPSQLSVPPFVGLKLRCPKERLYPVPQVLIFTTVLRLHTPPQTRRLRGGGVPMASPHPMGTVPLPRASADFW